MKIVLTGPAVEDLANQLAYIAERNSDAADRLEARVFSTIDRLAESEMLDLHTLDRIHRIIVEPIGRQDAEPFLATASLSWRWSALQTARTNTTEEDVVTEMFGRHELAGAETERPWQPPRRDRRHLGRLAGAHQLSG